GSAMQTGGGMIGAIAFSFCYYLFSAVGANIVALFSTIRGFLLMRQYSRGDLFVKSGKKLKELLNKIREKRVRDQEEKQAMKDVEISTPEIIDSSRQEIKEDEPVIQDFTDVVYSLTEKEEKEENNRENSNNEKETVTEDVEDKALSDSLPMTETE